MSTTVKHNLVCPLAAVHKRLETLHRQWHQAEAAYFDPDNFLVEIQAAIQTSRTVSFVLQYNKRAIPEFDSWYGEWQDRFRSIPLMKWMIDARNKIEKQGDLELHSYINAEIVASYLPEGPVIQVPATLWDAPLKLWKSIPDNDLGEHVKDNGTLRIQRRWIENTLPEFELLEVVAISYGHLSRMLSDAHRQIGLEEPQAVDEETGETFDFEAMQGRLPCMIAHGEARTLNIRLATGQPVNVVAIRKTSKLSDHDKIMAESRYGIKAPTEITSTISNVELLNRFFSLAQRVFLQDGHHITIIFLLKDSTPVETVIINPEDHGEKYLIMRKVAGIAQKKGADAAILLGEVWLAPYDTAAPYRRAANAPDKQEALQGSLVTSDGDLRQITAVIRRAASGDVSLNAPYILEGGTQYIFSPLYEIWGIKLPDGWYQDVTSGDGGVTK